MQQIAMLGGGFIGRFYAKSLQGQRSRDRVIAIYARREETARQFATDYGCAIWSTDMESVIAHAGRHKLILKDKISGKIIGKDLPTKMAAPL